MPINALAVYGVLRVRRSGKNFEMLHRYTQQVGKFKIGRILDPLAWHPNVEIDILAYRGMAEELGLKLQT